MNMRDGKRTRITYCDAIQDMLAWIDVELRTNRYLCTHVPAFTEEAKFRGRVEELEAMESACYALLSLAYTEEED